MRAAATGRSFLPRHALNAHKRFLLPALLPPVVKSRFHACLSQTLETWAVFLLIENGFRKVSAKRFVPRSVSLSRPTDATPLLSVRDHRELATLRRRRRVCLSVCLWSQDHDSRSPSSVPLSARRACLLVWREFWRLVSLGRVPILFGLLLRSSFMLDGLPLNSDRRFEVFFACDPAMVRFCGRRPRGE